MIWYIYFQFKQKRLYFSAFFVNIHIFAIYLNRNIYVHTFENKHIIITFFFLFVYCETPDVRLYLCKTFEITPSLLIFGGERSLLGDLGFGRKKKEEITSTMHKDKRS